MSETVIFWALGAALAILAVAGIVLPLRAANGRDSDRSEGALAVYRDQLSEIERDRARGLLAASEADAATLEVERRMLRAGRSAAVPRRRGAGAAVLIAALVVPIVGILVYTQTGRPGLPSAVFSERADERARVAELTGLAAETRAELERLGAAAPPGQWVFLGQTLLSLGRTSEAADALAQVTQRDDAPSGVLTLWVEAALSATRGEVTPEIRRTVDRALRADPLNPAASYYLAYLAEVDGNAALSRTIIIRRLSLESEPAAWMASFVEMANRLGAELGEAPVTLSSLLGTAPEGLTAPGPDADQVAAAEDMAPEDRAEMIRGMVEGLASRLEEEPGDAEGWLRLARARLVLGDVDLARAALERAEALPDAASGPLAPAAGELRAAIEAAR